LSEAKVTAYNRYNINLMDKNDIDMIKLFVNEDTINNIASRLTSENYKLKHNNNIVIQDTDLMESSNKNYGKDLPWDKEVGFCDVLRNTDQDLYKNTKDSISITIY
jgi:hypothetical protein